MAKQIPATMLDLFEKPALAHLATVMPSGHPQVTPIWIDYDGHYLLVNTAKGRRKDLNVRERPQVGVEIVDPENPFRYLATWGNVVEISEEGADEHIDKLAKRYIGMDRYPGHTPTETREIVKIEIERVIANG